MTPEEPEDVLEDAVALVYEDTPGPVGHPAPGPSAPPGAQMRPTGHVRVVHGAN